MLEYKKLGSGGLGLILFALMASSCFIFRKFPDPYNTIKWIFTLFSINILMLTFLYKETILALPRLPKLSLYFIGIICILLVFNSFLHNVSLVSYENLRRFIFWAAVIFFLNFFVSQQEKGFNCIEKGLFIISFVFLMAALSCYIVDPSTPPYLTFGNINLAAEFIGFSLAFQFGSLVRLWRAHKRSAFLELLSSLSISYIYFTSCRSIIIALFLLLSATLILDRKFIKKILKIILLAFLIIVSVKLTHLLSDFILQNIDLHLQNTDLLSRVVPSSVTKSFSVRWSLYLNSLKMILENPLGVGVGQFEFASLPYMSNLFPEHNENMIFLSPHNEFLHLLAEDGVIVAFFFFILFCNVAYSFRKEIKRIFLFYPEFIFFSLILGIQSLFQFPLIQPLPYFLTALMIGYFFALTNWGFLSVSLTLRVKAILIGINILTFVIVGICFSSLYVSFNFSNNLPLNKLACAFGSRNWYGCLNASVTYLEKERFDNAKTYAMKTLEWQPLNFQGMKVLGLVFLEQGRRREACALFKTFDSFFQNQSSLRQIINIECRSFSTLPISPSLLS